MRLIHGALISLCALFAAPQALLANAPTTDSVGKTLSANCAALTALVVVPSAAAGTDDCKAVGSDPTPEEVNVCRSQMVRRSADAFIALIEAKVTTQDDAIRVEFKDDPKAVRRLHSVLAVRADELRESVIAASTAAWTSFTVPEGNQDLPALASAELPRALTAMEPEVKTGLRAACLAYDDSILEAAFPTPLTVQEQAASNVDAVRQLMTDAERRAFAEFSKAEGFTRSVRCIWGTKAEDGARKPALTCKPGLLVSGEEVSEIVISGVPSNRYVRVIVSQSEGLDEKDACPPDGLNLTCDEAFFDASRPRPIAVAVHTKRFFSPSWGGTIGRSKHARRVLRRDPNQSSGSRKKLAIVTDGSAPTIAVGVRVDGDYAAATVPVGYARWKVESGGFLGVSDLVDQEVVTKPIAGDTSNVKVEAIREYDNFTQDSGVFANFIPQNYQVVGISLGFATPSNRRPSVFFGPSIRVRTFGNLGLAALAGGVAMRSVKRYPDLVTGTVPADSKLLEGREQFELGWFVAFNLGFRIGAFGPSDEGK